MKYDYLVILLLSLMGKLYCTNPDLIEIKVLYDPKNGLIYHKNEIFMTIGMGLLEGEVPPTTSFGYGEQTFDLVMILISTLFAGLMSGMTVGYLSIDDLVLELKASTGTYEEKRYSEKVLPIISKRHWLLVTLLLCNATAMEALPIFLNRLVDDYAAIAISVSLVLVFGEVLPQAICTGPNQIKIAALAAPLTLALMYGTYPLTYPIALFLDWLLGTHTKSRFVNTELKTLIELHTLDALRSLDVRPPHHHEGGEFEHNTEHGLGLHDEQANLMISALEIKSRKVTELMIPLNKVFMVDYDEPVDKHKLAVIISKGYSRIPVFQRGNGNDILGILRIKQLIGHDFTQATTFRKLGIKLKTPLVIHPAMHAIELLREFKKGKSHMAFITEQVEDYKKMLALNGAVADSIDETFLKSSAFNKQKVRNTHIDLLGIVTLEDILEEMINIEILDEDDYAKTKKKKPLNPKLFSKIFK
jgi:metal transporter CNNM